MNLVDRLVYADRHSPKTIFIVGEPMTDVYIHGRIVECQDGCSKLIEESRVEVPGGASNAVRSLEYWQAKKVFPFNGLVGPIKTRLMAGNQCAFRYDDDRCNFDTELACEIALVDLQSGDPDAVLISDYDKGVMTERFIQQIISICTKRSIPCVADCKREPEVYKGCILKGNGDYWVKHGMPHTNSVATWGPCPPVIDGEEVAENKLPLVTCLNHVGAGDCFAAHLTLALAYGFSFKEAATIAHSAGRVYVQRLHNAPPHLTDIRADMGSWGMM